MPWNNQSGGSGGGGGPWGGGGNGGGPWGQGPRGPGGPQNTPPDLEEIIRRGQDRLKKALPGGGGFNPAFVGLGLAVLVGLWAFQSIYTVQPDEVGVELRFGKPKEELSRPGLHFIGGRSRRSRSPRRRSVWSTSAAKATATQPA